MSQRDSSIAAFLLVFDNLMQALTADYRKNHLTFQTFNYSCFPTATTKWNTAAIKIPLLFETGLFIWFLGWGKRRQGFNESDCWTGRVLQQSTGKVLTCKAEWAWIIFAVLSHFSLVVKSGLIISCHDLRQRRCQLPRVNNTPVKLIFWL